MDIDKLREDTLEELEEALKKGKEDGDIEGAHLMADYAIYQFILALGYDDICDAWDDVPKWYS